MPMGGVDLQRWIFVGGEKTEAGRNRIVPILGVIRPFVSYFYERATGDLFLSGYSGNLSGGNFRKRDYYPTLERLGIRTAQRRMNPHSYRYTLATRGIVWELITIRCLKSLAMRILISPAIYTFRRILKNCIVRWQS